MFDKIIIIWDMILILQYLMSNLYHGTESLSNLGPRIWNLVPDKLKQLVDIHAFKKEIKKWKPENCPCRLCKTYISHVGFIWSFKFVLVFEYTFRSSPPEAILWSLLLRENALTWSSSSAFTAHFFSAFSIGMYIFFTHVYVIFNILFH